MGVYSTVPEKSSQSVIPVMEIGGKEMERTNRARMSKDPRPDRGDRYIMDQLVGARSRCKNRREWVKVRRDILGSLDMLTVVRDTTRIRWAK